MPDPEPGRLETSLRSKRDVGGKLLVPYVTGGYPGWEQVVAAVTVAGADAIEIGIPFSDPVLDGPTIQEASQQALAGGATPGGIVDAIGRLDAHIPVAVMTYYNLAFRAGHERFASALAASGIAGAILADLPLEEIEPWAVAADKAGVETVLLAAPTASESRLRRIAERSRGFVYAVGRLGVTGERADLAATALDIARRLKEITDMPVLVGVGISTPRQAAEAAEVADGVVVGSALIRRLLDGEGPEGAAHLIGEFRRALS